MQTLNDFLTLEHYLEHNSEHNLIQKKEYSIPKIYDAKGDLSKRWYVYFSYRDPETNKLKRQKNIYGYANNYKNKEDRLAVLSSYRKQLLKLLKKGYNPFKDNTELYQAELLKKEKEIEAKQRPEKAYVQPTAFPLDISKSSTSIAREWIQPKEPEQPKEKEKEKEVTIDVGVPLREAFDFSLSIKKNQIQERSHKDYQYTTNNFIKWLNKNKPQVKGIKQIDKKVALDYLNAVLTRTSSRNRNNIRLNLSSLFQTLEQNEYIDSNPIRKITPLRSIPKRNKSYSTEEHTKIFEYLEKEDPILLLFINHFGFLFFSFFF